MAGGKGTRIASIHQDVPKPMIKILGKPVLQYQIENLKQYGLTDIILVIGHLGHVIQRYFGDGKAFGANISYFIEDQPLGTAGALFKMNLKEDFLLLFGDVIFDIDFNRFIEFHITHKAWASLIAHPNGHPFDSSLLVTEKLPPLKEGDLPRDTGKVVSWLTKEDKRVYYQNKVNAGIQILSADLLDFTQKKRIAIDDNLEKIDLDRDLLKANIKSEKIFAYSTPEYIKDMGTPERFYEVENDIRTGKVKAKNLSKKQKAIFLDRDGTINKSNGFITSPDQFELIDGVCEAIKMINSSGYLAIVITNQPVIARGEVSFETLRAIHDKMETELGQKGAYVDGIYYCPHHTDKGFIGERLAYKCNCNCRKPKPGMLLQAAKDFNIDLSNSYMIGDSENDLQAGRAAGCNTLLVSEEMRLFECIKKIQM